jgi:5-dehydro-2-deoxygluconokinase
LSLDVLTIGRVSVDLYPEQVGVPLAEVRTFRKMLGGSPTNVAVAAARFGRRAGVITKVGHDPFGEYVRRALSDFGVDPSRVGIEPGLRTPLAFCEIFPPDRFPLLFYRDPKAPDMTVRLDEVDLDEVARVPLFWTTGTGLSDEPSRRTTLACLQMRRPDSGITVHDLDYRPMFWSSAEEAARLARQALASATVVVGNLDEAQVAVGDLPAPEAAAALLTLGPSLAVVKLGADGALARTREECVSIPGIEVEVLNGLGAGDAFGGALCHALLAGWELTRALSFANAAGAFVASRLGCADDMPSLEDVEALRAA